MNKNNVINFITALVGGLLVIIPGTIPLVQGHPRAAAVFGGLLLLLADAQKVLNVLKKSDVAKVFVPLCVLACSSCSSTTTKPDGFYNKVATCARECLAECRELAVPVVQCLVSGNAEVCLENLVTPAVGITFDLVACMVNHVATTGEKDKLPAIANPTPKDPKVVAKQWITEHKIGFVTEVK